MKISLLCPSRNRLNKFLTFISSIVSTAKDINNIELVAGIDEDDPQFKTYKRICKNLRFVKLIVFDKNLFGEEGLSGLWNKMARECSNDIIAMVGDDMIFKSKNWDKRIIDTFKSKKDNLYLIHVNDGMRGKGNIYENVRPLAVNSFIHRDYIDLVGRYVQTEIPNVFQDTYLDALFGALKRKIYMHSILLKHLHCSITGDRDETADRLEETRVGVWDNNTLFHEKLIPVLTKEKKIIEKYLQKK